MAAPKVVSGARAKVAIVDPATGKANVIGIFNNVSYSLQYGTQAVYILGRYSPSEIDYTHMEPVQLTLGAWRSVGHGPHQDGKVPNLVDLLTHEYLEMAVIDRQLEAGGGDGRIAKIRKIRPTGYSTTLSARQLTEYTITAVGILIDDENTTNAEHPTSTDLP
jgi:hypothetical protein